VRKTIENYVFVPIKIESKREREKNPDVVLLLLLQRQLQPNRMGKMTKPSIN
jgi:hypothetical protein